MRVERCGGEEEKVGRVRYGRYMCRKLQLWRNLLLLRDYDPLRLLPSFRTISSPLLFSRDDTVDHFLLSS